MFKRIAIVAVLGLAGTLAAASESKAAVVYRPIAPVRRVAARAVLPPYPVARRVVTTPVIGPPVYGVGYGVGYPVGYGVPYGVGYAPAIYTSPYVYGGGVSVVVGY